jgi:hypothetical protein
MDGVHAGIGGFVKGNSFRTLLASNLPPPGGSHGSATSQKYLQMG